MSTRSLPGSSATPDAGEGPGARRGDGGRARAFAPVAGPATRVLILGSLPGVASLRAGQYYAHPQNGFWRLIGGVIGREIAALPYPARLTALAEAGIGLWDVIASAERAGSGDAAIRQAEEADIHALTEGLPYLRAIGFNGGTASRIGRRRLRGLARPPALLDLPSSSPAFAAMPFAAKQARWMALASYLDA